MFVAIFGGIAVALLGFSVYQNTLATTPVQQNEVRIDFAVFPAQDVIEVTVGQTARIPVMVEAPRGAVCALEMHVLPISERLPEQASIGLDRAMVALSSLDSPVQDIGENHIQRAAGAFLVISIPADAAQGSYDYALEARKATSDNEGQDVGKIFSER
ncbi:hypothetical protein Ngar_c22740 [Candidatus Nitrososphaera gargensis Ga9.2]|uniref:Uncharacterized protein n=1 Tax=Nitrososphaera gargensis (strain Ga9.2) TaxID=1237085 RepID=K0IND9_NITGG|nr:hypothetical protein [Candidatus Nitrososphaera gargensis]AFU59204.1 hypothetical protein Ngar_c22740 [Candidatus Nitrososphaera gargensis Ga9.2]